MLAELGAYPLLCAILSLLLVAGFAALLGWSALNDPDDDEAWFVGVCCAVLVASLAGALSLAGVSP